MSKPTEDQLEEFEVMFGDVLPSHIHEPIKFLYYWQLYLQIKNNPDTENTLDNTEEL